MESFDRIWLCCTKAPALFFATGSGADLGIADAYTKQSSVYRLDVSFMAEPTVVTGMAVCFALGGLAGSEVVFFCEVFCSSSSSPERGFLYFSNNFFRFNLKFCKQKTYMSDAD